MDAVKQKISNVVQKVKAPISNPAVSAQKISNSLPEFNSNKLVGKMFDNVVSIIILVGVLFLLVIFLSTQTFFTNQKINSIQKNFPNRSNLKELNFILLVDKKRKLMK